MSNSPLAPNWLPRQMRRHVSRLLHKLIDRGDPNGDPSRRSIRSINAARAPACR